MMTGHLTSDNLTALFRSLSQKRRSGTLEITAHGERFEVLFLGGKIVRAQLGGEFPALMVIERLRLSGRLDGNAPYELDTMTMEEVYEALVLGGFVSFEDFSRAKVAEESDLLHSLCALSEGSYEFRSSVPNVAANLSLSLPPGQLLIETIHYKEESVCLRALAGAGDQNELCVAVVEPLPGDLSEAEALVLETARSVMRLGELGVKTLLPGRDLTHALLQLKQKGAISISTEPIENKQTRLVEERTSLPDDTVGSALDRAHAEAESDLAAPVQFAGGMKSSSREIASPNFVNKLGLQVLFETPSNAALTSIILYLVTVALWGGYLLSNLSDALDRFSSAEGLHMLP